MYLFNLLKYSLENVTIQLSCFNNVFRPSGQLGLILTACNNSSSLFSFTFDAPKVSLPSSIQPFL